MIESLNNDRIKEYTKLNQKKYRDDTNMFIIEGTHLVEEAFKNNIVVHAFSLDDKYFKADDFIKQRITQFELQLKTFNQKISDLSNLIVTDNYIREKVESLNQFKEEMKDTIFKRRAMNLLFILH